MKNFNHYFLATLKNHYADFKGKATRSDYWYFFLFYMIIVIILYFTDTYVLNPLMGMTAQEAAQGGLLHGLYALAMLVPIIAIGVRRLHDTSRSGWWMLISLVPIIGSLILLFFFVQKSK